MQIMAQVAEKALTGSNRKRLFVGLDSSVNKEESGVNTISSFVVGQNV